MEENDSRNEKNLAIDEKRVEEIAEEINIATLNGKTHITIEDGRSIISINITKSLEKGESYDIEFGGNKIATVKKGDKVPSDILKKEIQKYQSRFNFDKMNNELERNPTESERANIESLRLEAELKQAIKEGRATKLRDGREITAAGEDLSLIMKRMFGERAHEVYRVKDKGDSHKFTYIGKGTDNNYFEPKGNRANEGRNSIQKCWVQNSDGSFERKTVDDMKVFGKYVIATDIADNAVTENTRTLIGQRTPRGEYILMPALDDKIINTSSNSNIKDNLARGNSIWEIDDVILAAELGNTIRGTKKDGKLSADEVEFIRKLKKEGVADEKVRRIVDSLLIVEELGDQGLNDASIKAILDTVDSTVKQIEELKKEDFSDEEIKQVMKLVHKGEMKFRDAKEKIGKEKEESEDGEKVRGVRSEGPWDDGKHY